MNTCWWCLTYFSVSFSVDVTVPSTHQASLTVDAVTRISLSTSNAAILSFGAVIETRHGRHRVKRRGLKGSVTKLLTKVKDMFSTELETVHLARISKALSFHNRYTLATKMDQIKTLDKAIVATIHNEEELETEVCDADNTGGRRIAFLTEFIKRASQPPMTRPPMPCKVTTESRESPKLLPYQTHTNQR